MSLYDEIGLSGDGDKAQSSTDVSGWGKGIKLLQSQLQLKKAGRTAAQRDRDVFRGKISALSPAVDGKQLGETDTIKNVMELTERNREVPAQNATDDMFSSRAMQSPLAALYTPNTESSPPHGRGEPNVKPPTDPDSLVFNIENEYDPLYPNDYDMIKNKQRKERQKHRDEERKKELAERERRRRERHRERDRREGRDKDDDKDDDDDYAREKRMNMGAAIAPPPSLMAPRPDDDDDDDDSGTPERQSSYGAAIAPPPNLDPIEDEEEDMLMPPVKRPTPAIMAGLGSGSVAAKIMAKYGFKEGSGLGKNETGMSTALQVEKTSKRGGKILSEKEIMLKEQLSTSQPNQVSPDITTLMKNPSKVVLLKNMVGPGEVDEDLEPEIIEECSKYGKVSKCVIFEIPEAPDEEAVRIFVEFESMPSAIKAVVDLNGRFFGGRTVVGNFYNLDKFRRFELAD